MAMTVENQSSNGFHPANLIILVLCILAVCGIGYSAFVKPSQSIHQADGSTLIQNYGEPQIPLARVGCWRLNDSLFWDSKQVTPKAKK